jgi:hypothetical protein
MLPAKKLYLKLNTLHRNPIALLFNRNISKSKTLYRSLVKLTFLNKKKLDSIKFKTYKINSRKKRSFLKVILKFKKYKVLSKFKKYKKLKRKSKNIKLYRLLKESKSILIKSLQTKFNSFYRATTLSQLPIKMLSTFITSNQYASKKRNLFYLYLFRSIKTKLTKNSIKKSYSLKNTYNFTKKKTTILTNKLFIKKLNSLSFKIITPQIKVNKTNSYPAVTYIALFLKFRLIILNFNFFSKKFLMKKQIFSFLKLNEAKRSILTRRKKLNTARFYKILARSSVSTTTLKSILTHKQGLLTKIYNFDINSSSLLRKESSINQETSELFLPRVKFKPGYQRM